MSRPVNQIIEDAGHPGLKQLARHWLALYERDGRIPHLHDVDPLHFPTLMKDVWIIDAGSDGEFRFRLSGETLVEWYGCNLKGRSFAEVCGPVMAPVLTGFATRVVQEPAATLHRMHSVIPGSPLPAGFERLGLPLRGASGRVQHLIGATVFDDRYYNGRGAVSTALDTEHWYDIPGSAAYNFEAKWFSRAQPAEPL